MRSPENVTPAKKPSTPKMIGKGASGLKPSTKRGSVPTADQATAQVKPIPIAPRMRRGHFRMIASDPIAAPPQPLFQSSTLWYKAQLGFVVSGAPNLPALSKRLELCLTALGARTGDVGHAMHVRPFPPVRGSVRRGGAFLRSPPG